MITLDPFLSWIIFFLFLSTIVGIALLITLFIENRRKRKDANISKNTEAVVDE